MLEELACGDRILAAGTGMNYQGMPVSAAALQAQRSRGAALLTVVPLLHKRQTVQNYLAVDLQHAGRSESAE